MDYKYVMKAGWCETDDVISNCIGGFGMFVCKKLYKWIRHQEI